MPPKNCGACNKLVYPMDELKCLDKTWHKACFKCQGCSMVLNMKNYKGYNKLPYCSAHYPTTSFTAVAETPEIKRIAQNTKLQSNVTYHAEFEASRGQYTAIADDPETLRVRKNMETISNVLYHGELVKKKEMEEARPDLEEENGTVTQTAAPVARPPIVKQSTTEYEPVVQNKAPPAAGKVATPFTSATNGQVKIAEEPAAALQKPVTSLPAPVLNPPVISQRQAPPPEPTPEPEPEQQQENEPEPEPEPEVLQEPEPEQEEEIDQLQSDDSKGNVCKALYDYTAGDSDEVSFNENDHIINCEDIDEGWMMGTVEKTGQYGMLPSNYVEKMNW